MLFRIRSFPPTTSTATAAFCRFSDRRCAVTTTSASPTLAGGSAAPGMAELGAAVTTCGAAVAEAEPACGSDETGASALCRGAGGGAPLDAQAEPPRSASATGAAVTRNFARIVKTSPCRGFALRRPRSLPLLSRKSFRLQIPHDWKTVQVMKMPQRPPRTADGPGRRLRTPPGEPPPAAARARAVS